jgi:hypothetical protein
MFKLVSKWYDLETNELVGHTIQTVERMHQAVDLVDSAIDTLRHGLIDWTLTDKDGNVIDWGKIIGG